MERWTLWPLAAVLGTAAQLQQAAVGPVAAANAVLAIALGALAWAGRRAGRWALGVGAVAMALAGWAGAEWRAVDRLAQRLDPALEGVDLQLTGVVAELPHASLIGTRFVLGVESALRQGAPVRVPERVALFWGRGLDGDAWLLGPEALRAGQRWRLPVRLRLPHGAANPHGFDAELWAFEQGQGATGSVRSRAGDAAVRLDERAGAPVERLRQHLRDRIDATVPDAAVAGLLAALVIGDQGAIDRAEWEVFRVTGVAHLMSISGLHVTLFAWAAGAAVARLWRFSPRAMLALPAPVAARWGGLALAAAYALLAGWGVPAQRTVGMLAVVTLLRSLGLRWPALQVLGVAGAAVVLGDPWALLQAGFWLSFVAVGLLMLSDPGAPAGSDEPGGWAARARRVVVQGLRTQAVATVGLAPLSLLFFQSISVVGFAANLLAIPLVTAVITPLALAGCLVEWLWLPAAALATALLQALRAMAEGPWVQLLLPAAPAWAGWLGVCGGALLVMPLPARLRLLGLPLLLPVLLPVPDRPPDGHFELVALDVGQGTSVLLRTRGHLLVYDTGPFYSAESDAGQRVLVPLLRARGERAVDLLVLSHRDADHVGGAASLLARVPVRAVSSSLPDDHVLLGGPRPHRPCRAGQRWRWDGVDFELLHPDEDTAASARRSNAVSCVVRVQGAGGSALLTGDIELLQELSLVAERRAALPSDVLLVPHHGSRTSSTPAFIEAVAPRTAVVQAGYRSRFGHPAPDVVARYQARSIALVRTDRCGAWTWRTDRGMVCQREVAPRYWHHRPGEGRPG